MATSGASAVIPESINLEGKCGHVEHDSYSMSYHKMKEVGYTKIPQGIVSSFKPPDSIEDTIYVTIKMSNEESIADNLPTR